MEPSISRYFTSSFLGNWEADMKDHAACVVQRLRPPRLEDAEVLGLKRIQEFAQGVPSCTSSQDVAPVGFAEGRGAYIREYFELVVMPLIARAQAVFCPYTRGVGRTASDVTYVIEHPCFSQPARDKVLGLHSELYDALGNDGSDKCVDFVVVSGKMFHSMTPEFFQCLLVAYQFPFGVVLIHKSSYPKVLVIVTYSYRKGMTVLGGAGDPACGILDVSKRSFKSKKKSESEDESTNLIWYSKPWTHPSRSLRPLDPTDSERSSISSSFKTSNCSCNRASIDECTFKQCFK